MKVLETLGRYHATQQKGIFQYRRTTSGVEVDGTVGQAGAIVSGIVTISHQEWSAILTAIATAPAGVDAILSRLSGPADHAAILRMRS